MHTYLAGCYATACQRFDDLRGDLRGVSWCCRIMGSAAGIFHQQRPLGSSGKQRQFQWHSVLKEIAFGSLDILCIFTKGLLYSSLVFF